MSSITESQQNFSSFNSNYDTNLIKDEIEELTKRMGVTGRIVPRADAFEIDMDISGYEPEEVKVSVKGNILSISGSHEVRGADGFTYSSRNFSRTYTLPDDIIKEGIRSVILADGHTMKIEAPSRFISNGNSDFHKMRA
jgi:HSP20 family molecular chaperone IbpA